MSASRLARFIPRDKAPGRPREREWRIDVQKRDGQTARSVQVTCRNMATCMGVQLGLIKLKEQHKEKVFQNGVMRKICGH